MSLMDRLFPRRDGSEEKEDSDHPRQVRLRALCNLAVALTRLRRFSEAEARLTEALADLAAAQRRREERWAGATGPAEEEMSHREYFDRVMEVTAKRNLAVLLAEMPGALADRDYSLVVQWAEALRGTVC